jgi:type IV pilus assembly protein PilW
MRWRNSRESGFTLTELLIGIVLSGIVIAGVYGFFVSQIKTYSLQEQLVEMQANVRISIDTIDRDLQNAGYDPTNSETFGITTAAFSGSNTTGLSVSTSSELYFTVDDDGDGVIDKSVSERFGFKIDSGSLGSAIISSADGSITGWDPIADNIESVSVTYTYANGTVSSGSSSLPDNSTAGRNLDDIRKVAISLTGKTNLPDPTYTHPTEGDNNRRLTLSTEVLPQNLAY